MKIKNGYAPFHNDLSDLTNCDLCPEHIFKTYSLEKIAKLNSFLAGGDFCCLQISNICKQFGPRPGKTIGHSDSILKELKVNFENCQQTATNAKKLPRMQGVIMDMHLIETKTFGSC